MSIRKFILGAVALLVVFFAVIIATSDHGGGDSTADAKETDGAFIVEMIPHHESAIEMAEIATERGEHPEVKALAEEIIAAQAAEIGGLERIHQRLFGQPTSAASHGTLGLPDHEMGMHMEATELADEKPFDKAFIDMMIPHHQGAIRMARIELAQGENTGLMNIFQVIIDAQAREIDEMNRWRKEWYGASSPAGGVPAGDEAAAPSHEEMGH